MDKRQKQLVCNSALFCGIEQRFIEALLEHPQIKLSSFLKGEAIFPSKSDYGLCILLSGSAECYNGNTLLNRYREGDCFGAASLFCNEEYPTVIYAKTAGSALYISRAAAEFLIAECPQFAINYINFLSGKIHLLNRKIDSFTADNSLKKVSKYILSNTGGNELSLNISLSRLALALDIGRASLYRSLDYLEQEGIITRVGRKITILNANKLKNV